MASSEEVEILVRLAGKTAFIRDTAEVAGSVEELGVVSEETGLAMERSGRRGLIATQALFTARRLLYGATLATVALGIGAVKMGFDFSSAMQQARVALGPVSHDIGGVQKELNYLFNFTKYTPFQFKDVTIAFRQMYLGMRTVGVSATDVNQLLHSMVDALAATGRTSPGALNRVAVALQHMAYQGHLTGYTVNQLARDGIPIFAALRTELGLTGDQLHQVGALGIPTGVVLRAINKYIETTPGLANAAHRQATRSLHGLFTTFRDNISQLMGNMESGVFHRFQMRLVAFNDFFGRISESMRKNASFSDVVGKAFGGAAEFVWRQFAADLDLIWHIFAGLVMSILRSKSTWATMTSLLIVLHGILIPVNFIIQHLGGGIADVLIPALIGWIIYARVMNTILGIQRWLLLANAGELGELSLGQLLYNRVIWATIVAENAWIATRSALNVLFTGTAIGTEFRALTRMELMALRLRKAFLVLYAPFAAITAETWAWTIALLTNPITWIVLGVIALTAAFVILYLRVRPFHDFVNWLWHHPLVSMFVPVIGPVVALANALYKVYRNLKSLYDLVRHPLRPLGGLNPSHGSFWRRALHFGAGEIGIPGLAVGGNIVGGGTVMVGEQGAELLNLPAGAQVQPLATGIGGPTGGAGGGERQPLIVQFVVGQRVLEQAVMDIIGGRLAQA